MASSAPPAAAKPWQPPLIFKASVACHLGVGVAVVAMPIDWAWAAGVIAANHAVLTLSGLWPRSTWLGQNLLRLPAEAAQRGEVAITLDDGPDPDVTPAVLDILDAEGARATFFCIGARATRQRRLCREIVQRGHSVQNHTQRHSHAFSLLGPRALTAEIGGAQAALADITGTVPSFFRAPAGIRNPFLAPVLQRLELQLVTWTRRGYDTVQRQPSRVLQRLTGKLAPGDILLLHDGHAARSAEGQPIVLAVLPALLRTVRARGLRAVRLDHAVAGCRMSHRSSLDATARSGAGHVA